MNLSAALTLTGQDNPSRHFETFTQTIDLSLIQQALNTTGTTSIRNRKLPADRVIFLILGMALFRNISIQAVCDHLHLTLPNQAAQSQSIRSSSLTQARDRLGIEPLKYLFELLASKFTLEHTKFDTWRSLTIFGMDGSTMCVPDSLENREYFGAPSNGTRGESAYPQARLVGLMRLGSHRLTGLNIGQYSQGEVSLAEPLYALIPDLSVLIVDRGFLCWPRFWHHQESGQYKHWLIRAKSNLRWAAQARQVPLWGQEKVIKEFGLGDQLVEIKFTWEARKADPSLPVTMQARVIAYQIPGFQPERLVTSLTDVILFPMAEVVGLYHERWEFELGLDEIKTHTLERVETVRSTTPDRVRQELWGLAITYNVVRQEMARIAGVLGVPTLRLSYRWCLLLFRNLWSSAWVVASGLIPKHLEQLVVDVENLLLPERRRGRRNPRAVKVKMSGYAKKSRAGAA
jgi:Insertion element 4 transposase N-terminal/Transposase DDE domain